MTKYHLKSRRDWPKGVLHKGWNQPHPLRFLFLKSQCSPKKPVMQLSPPRLWNQTVLL